MGERDFEYAEGEGIKEYSVDEIKALVQEHADKLIDFIESHRNENPKFRFAMHIAHGSSNLGPFVNMSGQPDWETVRLYMLHLFKQYMVNNPGSVSLCCIPEIFGSFAHEILRSEDVGGKLHPKVTYQ